VRDAIIRGGIYPGGKEGKQMTTATKVKVNICTLTGRACSYWGNGCLHPQKGSPTLFCRRATMYIEDSRQLRESGAEPFLGMGED
jgi:hypothetical protein